MCNIVEAYANEKAAEAHEKGLEQGLVKIANLYVRGCISYDLALEQVGDKDLLDRLIASQN